MVFSGQQVTYSYTGAKETVDISGIDRLLIEEMNGASGAPERSTTATTAPSGAGGQLTSAVVDVSAYSSLGIWVGEQPPADTTIGGWGRSDGGGVTDDTSAPGGGSTELWVDNESQFVAAADAGGGGGASQIGGSITLGGGGGARGGPGGTAASGDDGGDGEGVGAGGAGGDAPSPDEPPDPGGDGGTELGIAELAPSGTRTVGGAPTGNGSITIAFDPPAISGQVTDSGTGVEGATVALFPNSPTAGDDRVTYQTTDASGQYAFLTHPQEDDVTEWHVAAQYDDGSESFNALSKPGVSADLTASAIPDSGVSRWKFDEGSGTTATDSWGANDGTISGATYTTDAEVGSHALSFDGTDDTVNVPSDSSFQGLSEVTVAFWAKPDAVDVNTVGVHQQHSGGNTSPHFGEVFGFERLNTTAVTFHIYNGTSRESINWGGFSQTGVWGHFAGTYDGSTIRLYHNGSEVATASQSGTIASDTGDFIMGGRTFSSNYYSGELDDTRLYNKALTATEVSNLHSTGSISG